MNLRQFIPLTFLLAACGPVFAQSSGIISNEVMAALTAETSGEMALRHFAHIEANYSGFSPSRGSQDMAAYIADRARSWGLDEVFIEEFPSDGKAFFWTFKSEPWWEGKKAEVWLTGPHRERIASFDVHRAHLARFSRSADLQLELVQCGGGRAGVRLRR